MKALFFLYQRAFANRLKKALKKPATYIFSVLGIAYFIVILFSFNVMFQELGIDNPKGIVGLLTMLTFFITPANLVAYVKRKGLVFSKADVHFVFPSTHSPKLILLYAHFKQILIIFVLGVILMIGGVIWFQIPLWKMFIYFLIASVLENILEASMVVLLYGNERISSKNMKIFPILMYGIMLCFVGICVFFVYRYGLQLEVILAYLFNPVIQLVPVIGWNIAVMHLLFLGPTVVNVIGSILYLVTVVVLFLVANRMKCSGEYFEDAMKFAEDYAVAKEAGKRGEIAFIGKKKKYGTANVEYKGKYAKAIFYRQLLEYKKNRFFIFGVQTLIMLCVGIGIGYLSTKSGISEWKEYTVPAAMAYISFIFAGYSTKWNKELANAYTFLVPDTAFKKMWYATLIEHIRSFVDACLITIPAAIFLKLTPLQVILTIGIYICLQANKLYTYILVEGLIGNLWGEFGRQIVRMLLFGGLIGIGIMAAVLGNLLVSVEVGFLLLIIVTALLTLGCMVAASSIFERMETVN